MRASGAVIAFLRLSHRTLQNTGKFFALKKTVISELSQTGQFCRLMFLGWFLCFGIVISILDVKRLANLPLRSSHQAHVGFLRNRQDS